jgi:hypothetical protein
MLKKMLALAVLALGIAMATAPVTELPIPEGCGEVFCS